MAATAILTVNAGSSSLKVGIFAAEEGLRQIVHGSVQGIGGARVRFSAQDEAGQPIADFGWPGDEKHAGVFGKLLSWAQSHLGGRRLAAAGHRVVHGGRDLIEPRRLDAGVMAAMDALVPLAPLHQPLCLAAIRALSAAMPDLPQVVCFDTAFHRTMPEVARRFAIPRALHDEGIERYGFHGLSYEFIAGRLKESHPALSAGRVVVAHLGSGASLCAILGGRSVDTTMGMTALDGLMMGTRCGAIDPGVLLYLLQTKGLSAGALEDLLYHRSGLLGVSGESADMLALEQSGSLAAMQAVELFAWQVARQVCLMACAMGGLDGLVFTGGIGERSPSLRALVSARLGWLGAVETLVIPTNEEVVIASSTARLIR
jgi:acetate kinase